MPWHREPMKDVGGCDMPRELSTERGSEDFRMGKPSTSDVVLPASEYIGCGRERGEVKHLSTRRRRKQL